MNPKIQDTPKCVNNRSNQSKTKARRKVASREEAYKIAKRISDSLEGRKFEDSTKVMRDIRNG